MKSSSIKQSRLDIFLTKHRVGLQKLHEVMFVANIVCAFAYVALFRILRASYGFHNTARWHYYFYRSTIRINNFLHLNPTSPSEPFPDIGSQWGLIITWIISLICTITLLLLILRMSRNSRIYRMLLNTTAALITLLGLPIACLYSIIPGLSSDNLSFLKAVFIAEVICIFMLFIIHRKKKLSLWTLGFLFFLYCGSWMIVACGEILPFDVQFFVSTTSTKNLLYAIPYAAIFLGFPVAGIVWLFYEHAIRISPSIPVPKLPKRTITTSIVSFGLLLLVWLPPWGYSVAHPKDINSVKIEMHRGPCFGACPVYTVTINGNGTVQYDGQNFVSVRGPQTSAISQEQVMQLLEDLDRIHFSTLEERAFGWCYDDASFAITVSGDGKSKSVRSNVDCIASKSDPQGQLVEVSNKIDAAVNSYQWIKCSFAIINCRH